MVRFGCQTYTWEMLGPAWQGDADEILVAIAGAGYGGIEITDRMIGAYAGRSAAFGGVLQRHGLALVAFALGSAGGFSEADHAAQDLAAIDAALAFLAPFPGAVLSLGSATQLSPGNRRDKLAVAARIYNEAGRRGAAVGVPVALHPSSHHGTLLFSRSDYDEMFAQLDPALVGWVPDTGHILRGGQDLLDTLAAYRERIRYLHLKDVDATGTWRMLGEGACDIRAVVDHVAAAPAFNGWVVAEEESDEAGLDPAAAVRRNRETLRRLFP